MSCRLARPYLELVWRGALASVIENQGERDREIIRKKAKKDEARQGKRKGEGKRERRTSSSRNWWNRWVFFFFFLKEN